MPLTLRRALFAGAVALAAAVSAGVVGLVSFAMGLVVEEWFLVALGRPVAAVLTGIAGALGAAWGANLLAPDRSRTRLSTTLAWSLAAATLGFALFHAYALVRGPGPHGPALVALVLVVTIGATAGALRARRPRSPLRRDALASLGLLLALPLGLYGAVGLACLLDACGA